MPPAQSPSRARFAGVHTAPARADPDSPSSRAPGREQAGACRRRCNVSVARYRGSHAARARARRNCTTGHRRRRCRSGFEFVDSTPITLSKLPSSRNRRAHSELAEHPPQLAPHGASLRRFSLLPSCEKSPKDNAASHESPVTSHERTKWPISLRTAGASPFESSRHARHTIHR